MAQFSYSLMIGITFSVFDSLSRSVSVYLFKYRALCVLTRRSLTAPVFCQPIRLLFGQREDKQTAMNT